MLSSTWRRSVRGFLITGAIGSGFIIASANTWSWPLVAILAVAFVATILIARGRIGFRNESEQAYFTAAGILNSRDTHNSIGSTWVMLGNVLVANMVLGQAFGGYTLWMLITWAWAFVVLSRHVREIRFSPSPAATLHQFLYEAYDSISIRRAAALTTVVAAIGILSIELVLGVAIYQVFAPANWAVGGGWILMTIALASMAGAAATGGLRAIIESDSLLWLAVITGTILLPVVATASHRSLTELSAFARIYPKGLPISGLLAFGVGLFVLQVPLLVGDFGTWQRIRATAATDVGLLERSMVRLGLVQLLLWGSPVIAGMILATIAPTAPNRGGALYAVGGPLIELGYQLRRFPAYIGGSVGFIILVGLTAVMVTTADGYLMIALEAWVRDLMPSSTLAASRSRRLSWIGALLVLLPTWYIARSGGSLIGLISTFFGALTALSAPTSFALMDITAARRIRGPIVISIMVGLVLTVAAGSLLTFGGNGGSWDWWHAYGVFLTPLPALLVPLSTILFCCVATGESKAAGQLLARLFSPWPFRGPGHSELTTPSLAEPPRSF